MSLHGHLTVVMPGGGELRNQDLQAALFAAARNLRVEFQQLRYSVKVEEVSTDEQHDDDARRQNRS